MAFIDAGDQFIALSEGEKERPDDHRHVVMVDDKRAVRRALKEMNVEVTKGLHILRGMGLGHLKKTESALEELRRKGLAPDAVVPRTTASGAAPAPRRPPPGPPSR